MSQSGKLIRCCGYTPLGIAPHYAPIEHFRRNKYSSSGLQTNCFVCDKARKQYQQYKGGSGFDKIAARKRAYAHKKKNLPYDISVEPYKVWLYNLGICHICLKPVPYALVVMEHVIGVSAGGGWTWDNIKPAHAHCNSRKNSTSMEKLQKRGILEEMRHPAYTKQTPLALTP